MSKSDQQKDGFYVTKKQAVIICLLFLLVLVGVGLMAGLIPDRGDDEILLLPIEDDNPGGPGESDGPWTELRLPEYIKPVHYNLWFHPDFYFDGTTFMGRSDIEIQITQDTEYVLIHYKLMEITVTELQFMNGDSIEIVDTFAYEPHEYWVIQTATPIPSGSTVMLHLEFNGSLVNGIVGYYKSTYVNSLTGVESWLATTKFQPTDARKAFPCFDEPGIKAQYTVALHHWANFTGLSNTPEQSIIPDGDIWVTTQFGRTVTMSTYLVCFIVTDFTYISNTIEPRGIPSRIWAAPDKIELLQADYALATTKTIFEHFQELFDYDYPLEKLDQVAVPDYPSGATEHWGLMTYRQAYLLYDEATVSTSGKQTTASIISHEIAHNYFGNEVTCAWWDEIWLNEGFAVYYENQGVDVAEPSWEMYFGNPVTCAWWSEIWLNEAFARYYQPIGAVYANPQWRQLDEHFVLTTQQGVMRTDAGANSRSVVVEVETPEQINAAFDGITYDKGASMLRMIESFMGPASYIKGVQRYLHGHLKDVAVTDDLWAAFQEVATEDDVFLGGETFANIMNPWVHQMGLPVITVTIAAGQITCVQARFMNNEDINPEEPPSEYGYVWSVPLTYTPQNGEAGIAWIHDDQPVTIGDPRNNPDTEWLKFNNEQKGFYRVNYPIEEWQLITETLNTNLDEFAPVDRSNLLDDAFNLARAGVLDYNVALDMSEYLDTENHLFPWRSAKAGLDYIATMIYGESSYLLWRQFIRDISTTVMLELGFEDNLTEHLDELLRIDMIELTCDHGYTECKTEMQTMFDAWVADDSTELSATLRPLVYEFGIKFSDNPDDWELMKTRYLASSSSQERAYMLEAMAQTQVMFLVDSYLNFIEDPVNVRDQDFVTAVHYTSRNPVAYLYTWNWIKTNYEDLEERFGIEDRTFARMVPDYVMDFNTQYLYDDVSQFYEDYPEAGAGELARQQSLDSISANMAWVEKNLQTISEWLQAR